MADPQEILVAIGKWALAGVSTLGASAALYVGRRYKADRAKLHHAFETAQILKRRKVVGRVIANTKIIRELRKQQEDLERENKLLQNDVRTANNQVKTLEATCHNLSSLVEIRAKEHHRQANELQNLLNRLTIVETKISIPPRGWQATDE